MTQWWSDAPPPGTPLEAVRRVLGLLAEIGVMAKVLAQDLWENGFLCNSVTGRPRSLPRRASSTGMPSRNISSKDLVRWSPSGSRCRRCHCAMPTTMKAGLPPTSPLFPIVRATLGDGLGRTLYSPLETDLCVHTNLRARQCAVFVSVCDYAAQGIAVARAGPTRNHRLPGGTYHALQGHTSMSPANAART